MLPAKLLKTIFPRCGRPTTKNTWRNSHGATYAARTGQDFACHNLLLSQCMVPSALNDTALPQRVPTSHLTPLSVGCQSTSGLYWNAVHVSTMLKKVNQAAIAVTERKALLDLFFCEKDQPLDAVQSRFSSLAWRPALGLPPLMPAAVKVVPSAFVVPDGSPLAGVVGDAQGNEAIGDCPVSDVVVYHAKRIQKLRRWHMNRHQLKKLRKRMRFEIQKRKVAKQKKKDKARRLELARIKKDGETFDALAFIKKELEIAKLGGYNLPSQQGRHAV